MPRVVRIRSKKAGFRRCGIAHPEQWTEYPAKRFTDKEIERLLAEPMLQVDVLDLPDPEPEAPEGEDAPADPKDKEPSPKSQPGKKGK
ncbi:MAG: HI1506-related protein [Syntrophus sp. (in: bacteria)]|nr:HI1506-related protein [Syntrophus sp. (in: bacteria)]